MNIEQKLYDLERRCKRLQLTFWVILAILACTVTLGMTQQVTIGGFLYPNTIHRVELVHTRDNLGEIGWIRGGQLTVDLDSSFTNNLRSKPLKVNLTNPGGYPLK